MRAQGADPGTERGATLWLTGLPCAGKTTLAEALALTLRASGHRVEVLDGGRMRTFLTPDLGFSHADRDANVRRIGFVAELLARHGVKAIVPVIAPFTDSRSAVRRHHDRSGTPYVEIHVATPVEVCAQRDVKGLYALQRAGRISGLTGVDDVYEPPPDPDARLDTAGRSVRDCTDEILALMSTRGLLCPPRPERWRRASRHLDRFLSPVREHLDADDAHELPEERSAGLCG